MRALIRLCARHPKWAAATAAVLAVLVIAGALGGNSGPKRPAAAGGASTAASGAARSSLSDATGTEPHRSRPTSTPPESPPPARTTRPAAKSVSPTRRRISSAPADGHRSTGTALALLATLKIKGRAPQTGYSREQFGPAWTDDNDDPDGHNGCRTRDDILDRDLRDVTTTGGCTVLSGTLVDPYTGRTIRFHYGVGTSTVVQIDHVVALDDAWQKGAKYWTVRRRTDLANDPLNLLAVYGPTNEAKGAGDAATWLPPNKSYRCAYVARQVAVKVRYGLWVTRAEHDAIARILRRCPGQRAPVEGGHPPAVEPREPTPTTYSPQPATTYSPQRPPQPATSPAGPPVVEFQNCTEMHRTYPHGVGLPGAHDHTSGTPDTRFYPDRALYEANTKSDRDKDGIACEA